MDLTEQKKKHLIVDLLLIIMAMQLNIFTTTKDDDDGYGFTFDLSWKHHLMNVICHINYVKSAADPEFAPGGAPTPKIAIISVTIWCFSYVWYFLINKYNNSMSHDHNINLE